MSRNAHITVLNNHEIKQQFGANIVGSGEGINWQAVFYHNYAPLAPIQPQVNATVTTMLGNYGARLAKGEFDLNTMLRLAEEETQKAIDEILRSSK